MFDPPPLFNLSNQPPCQTNYRFMFFNSLMEFMSLDLVDFFDDGLPPFNLGLNLFDNPFFNNDVHLRVFDSLNFFLILMDNDLVVSLSFSP